MDAYKYKHKKLQYHMPTLQDLKDKIEEIEQSLSSSQSLEGISLQHSITDDYKDIDIEIYSCLGFYYASILID